MYPLRVSILFIVMGIKWTDEEIKILIDRYSNSTNIEIIKLFKNRTLDSIKLKAKRLKLHRNKDVQIKNRRNAHIGKKNGMYGKKSNKLGKTYEEYYGEEKSNEIKNKLLLKRKKVDNYNYAGKKNGMYGKIPHNKGKSPSDEVKNKISVGIKKYWNNLSEFEYNKRKIKLREEWIKKRDKYCEIDTIPEKITEKLLIELNIKYIKKENIGFYNCDFVINNKVIEVQGDYWHANPIIYENRDKIQEKNYIRDKRKVKYLNNLGYNVLLLWEYDLKNNIIDCKSKIKKFIENEDII